MTRMQYFALLFFILSNPTFIFSTGISTYKQNSATFLCNNNKKIVVDTTNILIKDDTKTDIELPCSKKFFILNIAPYLTTINVIYDVMEDYVIIDLIFSDLNKSLDIDYPSHDAMKTIISTTKVAYHLGSSHLYQATIRAIAVNIDLSYLQEKIKTLPKAIQNDISNFLYPAKRNLKKVF